MMKIVNFGIAIAVVLLSVSTTYSQGSSTRITINNDLEIIQLTPNIYIHLSCAEFQGIGRFASNGMILTEGDQAFLFDTPPNVQLTQQLVDWMSQTMKLKIVGFIPNHWHIDCMGGLSYLNSIGVKSYANQMTIDIAKVKNLPLPTKDFKDSLTLYLGKREIFCYYPGAGHSMDNIVTWLPDEKILFGGCLLKSPETNNKGNTKDADLKAWPVTVQKVKNRFLEARIVIPGHGVIGDASIFDHTIAIVTMK